MLCIGATFNDRGHGYCTNKLGAKFFKMFTNWINKELNGTLLRYDVKDIQTGFQDRLVLLALLKKLHSKSILSMKSAEGKGVILW